MDLIALSIPIFFALIGLELLISYLQKSPLYRFNDAITNLSCGITQQVASVFLKTILILLYGGVYTHFRLFDLPQTWWMAGLLFIGVDFFYYWFHRYAHEISLFWGTHIVHHQSEEYNLTVALRQSIFQIVIATFFFLPLALIGFDPKIFVPVYALQTLYQFWIHTKTIQRMPAWFEFIFNTPAHHRVHHGVNKKYIDKNHGGTLIIFDRLFGTFQEEEEEPTYGVTVPLGTWNPVWANIDYYAWLKKQWVKSNTLSDKLGLLFRKPGWRPASAGGTISLKEFEANRTKFDTNIPMSLNYYVFFQYAILLGGVSWFLFAAEKMQLLHQISCSLLVFWATLSISGIFEQKRWIHWAEPLRLLTTTAYLLLASNVLFTAYHTPIAAFLIIWSLISAVAWFLYKPVTANQ
jgi:sterol desaturase/sphingolipid hydroxylase (fatty acid hydroxylase superfamily)